MRRIHRFAVVVMLPVAAPAARAQVVASLPFTATQTAGPTGTNYESSEDDRDLWIIEDFSVSESVVLNRFEAFGTVFPAPAFVFDVTVHVYDAMPPAGNIVVSSVPQSGTVAAAGGWNVFRAQFGGQTLSAGSYFIVWNASTRTSQNQRAIFWAQGGPHAVGGGLPQNAWLWNPGGGWGYPNNLKPVPEDLLGNGQTGVNFTLFGGPVPCYANCDGSTIEPVLTGNDFLCFLSAFVQGSSYANCDGSTGQPVFTANDFVCFVSAYAAGCS
jgi:hypothetical protein